MYIYTHTHTHSIYIIGRSNLKNFIAHLRFYNVRFIQTDLPINKLRVLGLEIAAFLIFVLK